MVLGNVNTALRHKVGKKLFGRIFNIQKGCGNDEILPQAECGLDYRAYGAFRHGHPIPRKIQLADAAAVLPSREKILVVDKKAAKTKAIGAFRDRAVRDLDALFFLYCKVAKEIARIYAKKTLRNGIDSPKRAEIPIGRNIDALSLYAHGKALVLCRLIVL